MPRFLGGAAARQVGRGTPLPAGTRREMEGRFGADFTGVRVHADGHAAEMARSLGARAYTLGRDVVFGAAEYRPHTLEGRRLIAHELAHVVQQGGPGSPSAAAEVSRPGDPAERRAEHAADAVARGGGAGDVGRAAPGVLHRAVSTSGGEWDTTGYVAVNVGAGAGKEVGADITLNFTPGDLVEADTIGLVQTVKTLRASSAGDPVNTPSNARRNPVYLEKGEGDVGRGIDQLDTVTDKTLPQTSPLYAVGNKQVPDPADPTRTVDTVAKTLTDVRPDPANGWGQHGAHTRNVLGAFNPPVDAVLIDTPRRALDFDGQEWRQTFEVAALALDGPMAGTYLGSVEWGWLTDATGTAALSPTPISMVRFGAPSGDFMAAARKWNRMTFQDTATGTSYDSVDLPTTLLESGGVPPKAMSTAQLAARIAEVTRELAAVDAVAAMTVLGTPVMNLDPDRKSKALEKRALEAELALRADQPTVPLATHEAAAAALGTRAVIARLGQLAAEIPPLPTGADRTNRELERHALEAQLRTRSLKLSVTVHETEDVFGSDTVYATVSLAGKSHRSGTGDLNNGESRDIVVPLSSLLPAPLPPADAFAIRLYDEDWEGDDLMLDDSWPAPYAAHRSIQSRDGGKYEVLVDFDR